MSEVGVLAYPYSHLVLQKAPGLIHLVNMYAIFVIECVIEDAITNWQAAIFVQDTHCRVRRASDRERNVLRS